MIGLRDGTISGDGLDTFKLGYQFVRDEISLRREACSAQAGPAQRRGQGVVVKTAQAPSKLAPPDGELW